MRIETFFLACEQCRPYKPFDTLKEAKEEVQPWIDKGYDFQIVEVQSVAWHASEGWKREPTE